MFEFQSVRRSFPRNLAENSEAASFLNSYLPSNYFNVSIFRWLLCHFYEIICLLLCFFSDLYFPPKNSGENIRSASGFIAQLGWETPVFFYTFYLVYIWHCRIKLFLRHLPNCFSAVYISRQSIMGKIFGAHLGFSLQVIHS
jgi:hypothetical protein